LGETSPDSKRLCTGKPPFLAYGRLVHTTNYDNLFLTDELEEPLFRQRIHPREMSVMPYVNLQAVQLKRSSFRNGKRLRRGKLEAKRVEGCAPQEPV
jgi:hypothetical protein